MHQFPSLQVSITAESYNVESYLIHHPEFPDQIVFLGCLLLGSFQLHEGEKMMGEDIIDEN